MKYVILAFTSRNEAIRCATLLNKQNIYNLIINTPESLKIGCGLSVKIIQGMLPFALDVVRNNNVSSFKGVYVVLPTGYKKI